jgi:hypothetical protein
MLRGLIFSFRKERVERGTGAHRIASFLRESGWDIEVLDFCNEWTLDELQEFVKSRVSSDTKFFGFSSFISWWPDHANDFTDWLKKTYPDIVTILGGHGALITESKNIDYYIDSFGEVAMLELCKYLFGNTVFNSSLKFEDYQGKRVIRALHAFPAWNLPTYRNKHEKRDFLQSYEMLTIESSRGCKFKCAFCNFPVLGVKKDISRSAEDLELELKYNYDNWGIKNYTFADETFNDRTEKYIKYASMIQRLNFDPWFMAFMRADLLIHQKPYWNDIKAMGLGGHFYGVETFNKEAGKIIGKGMDPDKLKEGLLEFRNFLEPEGIYRGCISLICGLPRETPETYLDSVDWLVKNWQGQAVTSWYLDLPDINDPYSNLSEFSINLTKYGLRRTKVIEEKKKHSNHHFFPDIKMSHIWEHDTMTQYKAMDLVNDFLSNYYNRKYFAATGFSMTTGLIQCQTNDAKIPLSTIKWFNDEHVNINIFLNNYKLQKLSWKND